MKLPEHKVNVRLSEEVYKKSTDIKAKQCYNNIFRVLTSRSDYWSKVNSGEWKVAYGYVRIMPSESLFARHCYIIDENEDVVDPTLAATNNLNREDSLYLSFLIFDSLSDYLATVEKNDLNPDLFRHTRKREQDIFQGMLDKGYIVIG